MKRLYYFTQGEKGLIAKFPNQKVKFPQKNSNIKVGFVEITTIKKELESYDFVDGYNVSLEEIPKEKLIELLLTQFDRIISIYKAETRDGIEGVVIRYSGLYERFLIQYNNNIYYFDKETIKPAKIGNFRDSSWTIKEAIFNNEDILTIYKEYTGINFRSFSFNQNELNEEVLPFKDYIKQDIIKKGNLAIQEGKYVYELNKELDLLFRNNSLYDKSPLVINMSKLESLNKDMLIQLMNQVKKYNLVILKWWKYEGLKLFKNNPKNISYLIQNLSSSPLWKNL